MKPWAGHIGRILLLGLMIYCFGMAVIYSESYSRDSSVYMLYQKDDPLSGKDAIKMQEKEEEEDDPLNFTVWGIKDFGPGELNNEELGRNTEGTALYIVGNVSLLFAYDGIFENGDKEGCLLSEDLAYDLFGSKNAEGLQVKAGGKELIVRGILKDALETIVIQADNDTEKILDCAAVCIPEGKLAASVLNTFHNRHNFGKDTAALSVLKGLANMAVMLISLVIGLCLALPWGRYLYRMKKQEESFFRFWLCLAGGICFLVLYVKITGITFTLPQDFTPTRWSDFSFWSNLLEEKQKELLTLFSVEKREPERILMQPLFQTVKYSSFTLGIYLFFIKPFRIKSAGILYLYVLCSICFAYITVLANREYAQVLAADMRLWLLAAVFLAGGYLLEKAPGKKLTITIWQEE